MTQEEESFLTEALDHDILMHREAHFGGSFDVMLDYYEQERPRCHPDFEVERIEYLAAIEKETGKNLAPLLLSASEAEAVARAKKAYLDFKKLYEHPKAEGRCARLIADLVLSEEEEPSQEIEAIIEEGKGIVPDLILLVRSEEAYDPLFPGFGYAPLFAILCLGKIGDPAAIIPLFETLGKETLFGEEEVLSALVQIGAPAQEFLLRRIEARPLTKDATTAALALTAFEPGGILADVCFAQMQDPEVWKYPLLVSYLLMQCDALSDRASFIALAGQPGVPSGMKKEMERIIRSWE